jgi:hypothetical protein
MIDRFEDNMAQPTVARKVLSAKTLWGAHIEHSRRKGRLIWSRLGRLNPLGSNYIPEPVLNVIQTDSKRGDLSKPSEAS